MNSFKCFKYYISIVSHGHFNYIKSNKELLEISKLDDACVVVKDNLHDAELERFCFENNISYVTSDSVLGFGANNNFVHSYCKRNLGMSEYDYFLVVNPDVIISKLMFQQIKVELDISKSRLFTVNLFKDSDFKLSENSLRKFPSLTSVFKAFLKKPICEPVDKDSLSNFSSVEWASGAFLGFKSELFNCLNGFDERYFMYYEDVDICYRSRQIQGVSVCFLKNVKAIHVGAYQNRNIFSKHFRWYLTSLLTFLVRKSTFEK
ncbi:glycosyltransferase family 2 protein [Shewanella xiamenensis]|uniref:glycosyltransferase family 2 protein n=1 Tax=Shewanella xiamenensis TaxID=332186 RepID=UPI0035B9A3CE